MKRVIGAASRITVVFWALCALGPHGRMSSAGVLMTKSGMLLEGKLGYLSSISENPLVANVPAGGVDVRQIVLLDDGLRRTYVSWLQIQEDTLGESEPNGFERIRIRQNVASGNRVVGSVNSILGVGPFDQRGRRMFSIMTAQGRADIMQGITEITPVYTRLQGLSGKPAIRWDSRVATSSISRETLSQVLRLQGVKQGANARMQVVRLLFEAERFNDARIELEQAMQEYPELQTLDPLLEELRQKSASRLIDEIQRRQEAGQHVRARGLLSRFPVEGVATEILLRVNEMQRKYKTDDQRIEGFDQSLHQLVAALKDPSQRAQVEGIEREISAGLNLNTMVRLSDFQRLSDDPQMLDESKLALLISGWLLGSGSASQNLIEAISLVRVRDLVLEYLQTTDDGRRQAILDELGREEGGTPRRVAEILGQLRPPIDTTSQPGRVPGNYLIQVPGLRSGVTYEYEVQLPDEYDPARRYPTILTLHGLGRSASQQIDWWAGPYNESLKTRLGQATRHGYIVIAPLWLPAGQRRYEYTGVEHAQVLASLRDACDRFSVDTDRVFLSGHSTGGDAAWDIGLAHPDLWAGVIPIVAAADYGPRSPKYVSLYWENARYLPWYFVMGELDGNKLEMNRRDLNRYLKRSGYDVMVVEFIGRGHEHFYDEIHRLFEWMSLHQRDFHPDEFSCSTMRPFDNFFWYLELGRLPLGSMVSPLAWPAPSSSRPAIQAFRRTATNTLRIETGAETAQLWLSPDVVELGSRLTINVNGRNRTVDATPQVRTLLEDARSRSDRQHPFWSRIELVTGKRATN